MTTEQKMQHFLQTSIKDATTQSEAMLNDYKKAQDSLFEDHKEASMRQAQLQIKTEQEKAHRDMNKELSKQQLHIKRKISRKQGELKDQLFNEVIDLAKQYVTTADYEKQLIDEIIDSKKFAGDLDMTVYIDPVDAPKKEMLEQATGVKLTVSEYSFLGGSRAVISSKNILIDKSLMKKIEEAKGNFVFGGNIHE